MVEIGESSFTYLQIFYSLDYDIPLPSYKIVCWVLALIFHIGCHIKDFKSTILNISQKDVWFRHLWSSQFSWNFTFSTSSNYSLLPTSSRSLKPYWQAGSMCGRILEMKSHIDKPRELGVKVLRKLVVQLLSKSHSEFFWNTYETDYDKTLNDLIYLLISTSLKLDGHWQ